MQNRVSALSGGRPRLRQVSLYEKNSLASVFAFVGLIAVAVGGAIWTGLAVSEGSMAVTLLRFSGSVVAGLYYLTLYRLAIGHRFFQSDL